MSGSRKGIKKNYPLLTPDQQSRLRKIVEERRAVVVAAQLKISTSSLYKAITGHRCRYSTHERILALLNGQLPNYTKPQGDKNKARTSLRDENSGISYSKLYPPNAGAPDLSFSRALFFAMFEQWEQLPREKQIEVLESVVKQLKRMT